MSNFNKFPQVDPFRQKRNELATSIRQAISGLFTVLGDSSGIIRYGENGQEIIDFDSEFELEGRDDVVKSVIHTEDTETGVASIYVVTSYDGEEEEHSLNDLSVDDQLNVYEALKGFAWPDFYHFP